MVRSLTLRSKAPSNTPSTWSSWLSCVGTGFNTLGKDLNPLPSSVLGAAQNAVDAQSQAFADAAGRWPGAPSFASF